MRRQVLAQQPLMVTPKLDELPVYVRAGAIVPMAPLVQIDGEKPAGPLTLRVFPPAAGAACAGDVYQDDGVSFDFRRGASLRLHATCRVGADGTLTVEVGPRQGSFEPWWTEVRIEVVGARYQGGTLAGANGTLAPEQTALGQAVTVRETGKGVTVAFVPGR